jgi:hypothetical protein
VVKLVPEPRTEEEASIQRILLELGADEVVVKVTSDGPQVVSDGTITLSVVGQVAGQLAINVANT